MEKMSNLSVRMDSQLKKDFSDFCDYIGLSVSAAITAYIKRVVETQSIPFKLERQIPNKETIEALNEYENMKKDKVEYKRYDNFDQLMNEVLEEC